MKAIILTYDKYRLFREHMLHRYEQLWPDHPFVFRIPYQSPPRERRSRCEYIESPSSIQQTMASLLGDLPDDEWIYWALDDKYPVFLRVERVRNIVRWLEGEAPPDVSGVLFCRCRQMLVPTQTLSYRGPTPPAEPLLERINFQQIWIPQFLRAGALRFFFQAFPPEMALCLGQEASVELPERYRLFVTRNNLAAFGESTTEGRLTQNCFESLTRHGFRLPQEISVATGERIICGEPNRLMFLATLAVKRGPAVFWPFLKRLRRTLDRRSS